MSLNQVVSISQSLFFINKGIMTDNQWVFEFLNKLMKERFTGNVQINFQFGGISNLNKNESIKPPESTK